MEEINAGKIMQEWLDDKKARPSHAVEDFLFEKYRKLHVQNTADMHEKQKLEAVFQRRMDAWKAAQEQFGAYAGECRSLIQLESWQGTQMLENVILEFHMDETERYRYLLNVEMMIGAQISRLLDEASASSLKALLEQKYEEEWDRAQDGVTESEFQKRFDETVSLMQYAGIGYDDENRRILAEIGAGWQTEFGRINAQAAERDFCFLMDFIVSELMQLYLQETYSEEEQELMVQQAVPVCVSSVSMLRSGSSPEHVRKMAYSYLGRIFTEKNAKLLFGVAAVFVAAKALFFLLEIVIAGKVLEIGLSTLWERCCKNMELDMPEGFWNQLLEKITGKTPQGGVRPCGDRDWEEDDAGEWDGQEEPADEKEYEYD